MGLDLTNFGESFNCVLDVAGSSVSFSMLKR